LEEAIDLSGDRQILDLERFYCNLFLINMLNINLIGVLKYHVTHHKIHFWGPWAQQLWLLISEAVSHRCVRETFPLNIYYSLCLDALTLCVFTGDIVFTQLLFLSVIISTSM
jgi:hypothetical protein